MSDYIDMFEEIFLGLKTTFFLGFAVSVGVSCNTETIKSSCIYVKFSGTFIYWFFGKSAETTGSYLVFPCAASLRTCRKTQYCRGGCLFLFGKCKIIMVLVTG